MKQVGSYGRKFSWRHMGSQRRNEFSRDFFFQELVFIGRFGFVIEPDQGSNFMSLL
jgi:hypothetical protein